MRDLTFPRCITRNWYNTAMEISGGLNQGAVSRQKKLWAEVPAEATACTFIWVTSFAMFFKHTYFSCINRHIRVWFQLQKLISN